GYPLSSDIPDHMSYPTTMSQRLQEIPDFEFNYNPKTKPRRRKADFLLIPVGLIFMSPPQVVTYFYSLQLFCGWCSASGSWCLALGFGVCNKWQVVTFRILMPC
ncbi:unnamed protein product, partial [Owenia fusiformis]